jgi:3-oxoadipate enol-lactonase
VDRGISRSAWDSSLLEGDLSVVDEGDGPTVLCLHGQPGSKEDFANILALLAPSFRILVPDRFGYGQSMGPARSMVEQADAYFALLVESGAMPAIVVGHSYGAGIAILLAARHPTAVQGLVLVAPIGGEGSVTTLDKILALSRVGPVLCRALVSTYGQLGPLIAKWTSAQWIQGNVPLERGDISRQDRNTFAVEQGFLVDEISEISKEVANVSCPVLVMASDHDLIVSSKVGRDLAQRVGRGTYISLDRCGHYVLRDDPDEVAEAIQSLSHDSG